MGILISILKAIAAAFNVFKQERETHNRPDIVKNKLDLDKQATQDALNKADAVLADPKATAAQHAEALRQIRLASS